MESIILYIIQYVLLTLIILLTIKYLLRKVSRKNKNYAPSPLQLPIIGHMHILAKYPDNAWEGFDSFRKNYGDVVKLQIGSKKALLISSMDAIKEVLITKGELFANRPQMLRYLIIFGGDQENSLALCSWTELQKERRLMAQAAAIPRYGSQLFDRLNSCVKIDLNEFIQNRKNFIECNLTKLDILKICFNIFTNYFCSERFDVNDEEFTRQTKAYDFIFYDINQCYASDFLPNLTIFPPVRKHINQLKDTCLSLRNYLEERIINRRLEKILNNELHQSEDFVDVAIRHHLQNVKRFNWTHCLFEIEDLVGGNSAVGNLVTRLIGHLALSEKHQEEIYQEVTLALKHNETVGCSSSNYINASDRLKLPYTEACILETLRIASSPIVPHIPVEDTTIQGYFVEKDTMVMLNNYHLNTSDKYWKNPKEFNPKRFLQTYLDVKTNKTMTQINKPEHYFPFSFGRRSCIGYKLVSTISLIMTANLVKNFTLSVDLDNEKKINKLLSPKGSLALHYDDCYDVKLKLRA